MKKISYEEYISILDDSRILIPGKVFELRNGNILKLFRLKRFFTSGRLFPFARRFAGNAEKLKALQIPTVQVLGTYRIPVLGQTAVLYEKLKGIVLDDRLGDDPVGDDMAERLAAFVAALHEKGVYFRSIHSGNIVICPHGEFGLIDILDMSIHHRRLGFRLRLRNFNHIFRNDRDRKRMRPSRDRFLKRYQSLSSLTGRQAEKLQKRITQLLNEPGRP